MIYQSWPSVAPANWYTSWQFYHVKEQVTRPTKHCAALSHPNPLQLLVWRHMTYDSHGASLPPGRCTKVVYKSVSAVFSSNLHHTINSQTPSNYNYHFQTSNQPTTYQQPTCLTPCARASASKSPRRVSSFLIQTCSPGQPSNSYHSHPRLPEVHHPEGQREPHRSW